MPATKRSAPEHDEVESFGRSVASEEPTGNDFDITLSIPGNIEIRMVDASSLSDYEIWFSGASAILSILTGFVVAFIQETEPEIARVFLIVAVIFAVIFVACLVMTLLKRHDLRRKGKHIRLRTSRAVEDNK